jgi:protein SCO1/2
MRNAYFISMLLLAMLAGCEQRKAEPPTSIPGVTVDEHLDAALPLDLTFEDESGQAVKLGDYFRGGKPVILQLAYYRCPGLCTQISQGIVDSLKELTLTMGKDFQVVEVSIDPKETSSLAYQKKQTSMAVFSKGNEKELDPAAWHFLVGRKANIERLAETAGYRYVFQASTEQYIHPAVIMVCSPQGHVTRYLYGTVFPSQTLRLSLVEASGGKVGTSADKRLLLCFYFDPNSGRYVIAAVRFMQAGAALTMVVLGAFILRWIRKERRSVMRNA